MLSRNTHQSGSSEGKVKAWCAAAKGHKERNTQWLSGLLETTVCPCAVNPLIACKHTQHAVGPSI